MYLGIAYNRKPMSLKVIIPCNNIEIKNVLWSVRKKDQYTIAKNLDKGKQHITRTSLDYKSSEKGIRAK